MTNPRVLSGFLIVAAHITCLVIKASHMDKSFTYGHITSLTPSPLKQITYADKGKSKVLGLGKVAICKDMHMVKVMLVESLGFNLMSV